jgi:hypothetical protein
MVTVKANLAKLDVIKACCFLQQREHMLAVFRVIKNGMAVFNFELTVHPCLAHCRAVSNWVKFSHFSPDAKVFIERQLTLTKSLQ